MMKYIFILVVVIKSLSCNKQCKESSTIIDVSKDFRSCVNNFGNNYQCPNIKSAFKYVLNHTKFLNHTCIRLQNDQYISNLNKLNNVNQLIITKHENVSSLINITCSHESGLALYNSSNISLYGLRFHQCGVKNSINHKYYSSTLNMSTAFFVYQVKYMNITDVSFISSKGYAVVLIDVSGNLLFKRVNVNNGTLEPNIYEGNKIDGYSSGGGIYLEYRNSALTKYSSDSHIKFEFCQFFNNTADMYNIVPNAKGVEESHIPFGRGGGLTLMVLGKASGNILFIRNCTFAYNVAAWGGGVYIRFRENASMNRILLDGVNFTYNKANMSGGGMIVSSTQQSGHYHNNVSMTNSMFVQNNVSSGEGGGLTLLYLAQKTQSQDVVLKSCKFDGNTSPLGSALHLQNVHVMLIDLHLHGIGRKPFAMLLKSDTRHRAGGLYAFQCRLVMFGSSNLVSHNKFTGFILDSSSIDLNGQLDFISNEGYNGGALSLLGRSNIILNQTAILNFRNNSANKNGGAIYVSIPNSISFPKYIDFQMYPCFFIFKEGISNFNGKTTFGNNICNNSGSAIFTSTLQNCHSVDTSVTHIIKEWRNFEFSDNQTITTNAIRITVFPVDWVDVWPGKVFRPRIHLLDEQNNTVDEAIDISIHSKNKKVQIESQNRRFLVTNNSITLKLLVQKPLKNNYEMEFNITVSLSRDGSIKTKTTAQKLVPCLLGFTFTTNQCVCNIQHNEVRGIAACYEDKSYILLNRWARPNQKALATDSETTQVCPPNYCRSSRPTNLKALARPYEPNNQCQPDRDQESLLCSRCKQGSSVAFGSENCVDCTGIKKWYVLWIIPLMIFGMLIFVVIIVFLNIDIYRYYLNGFFYYYQVVMLLIPSNFKFWKMKSFISIINLSSTGSTSQLCLWNGLNDMEKMFFNYLIPVSMILILVVLSVIFNHQKILRKNCIRAFIAITVWAYSDLTRITFMLLKPATINGEKYVYIYAHVKYMSLEHLPYFIIACIFIIIIIAFPLMLMLSSWLCGLQFRGYPNPLARWQLVFDSFKYCFKKDRQFFVSYYFLCRLLLLAISTFAGDTPEENLALALLCLCICMVFQVLLPYEKNVEGDMFWTNMFDVMVLANLAAVSVLSLAVRIVRKNREKHYFMYATNLLMCVPLLLVLIRILYLNHSKWWKLIKKQLHRIRRDDTEYDRTVLLIDPDADNVSAGGLIHDSGQ